MENKFKSFTTEIKDIDEDNRIITVVGSKQIVDRDAEIVDLKSMNLKHYKENSAFIWSHRPSDTPENVLGHAKRVWIEDNKLMFKLEFLPENVNPRADMVRRMYQHGALKAFSIGFSLNSPDDIVYDDKKKTRTLMNAHLFEISAVVIPANPAALIESKEMKDAISKGIFDSVEVKDFEIYLKELGFYENQTEDVENKTEQKDTNQEIEKTISLDDVLKEFDIKIKNVDETIFNKPTYLDSILNDMFVEESDVKSNDSNTQTKKGSDLEILLDSILG